jgi:hypothetical protein
MGYRIQSYTQEELKKLSLPGGAVTALFWAIPVGEWKSNVVESWWLYFTQNKGFFQESGLLVVHDYQANGAAGSAETSGVIDALKYRRGARLTELLPAHRKRGEVGRLKEPALLVLAGSYPQPGWGVLITVGANSSPMDFERLFADTALNYCGNDALAAIRDASNAYHERERIKDAKPAFNLPQEAAGSATSVLESYAALKQTIASGTLSDLDSKLTKLRNALQLFREAPPEEFWKAALRDIKIAKDVGDRIAKDEGRCSELLAMAPGTIGDASHAKLSPRDENFLLRVDDLLRKWPDLSRNALGNFLEKDAQTRLWAEWEPELEKYFTEASEIAAGVEGRLAAARRSYESQETTWRESLKQKEEDFRIKLHRSSTALWKAAPAFLIGIEKRCAEKGLRVESITWDAPRMIGWKLHCSGLKLGRSDVILASNGILPDKELHNTATAGHEQMDGSYFADYVYHVSINTPDVGRWEATKKLLTALLSLPQMRSLYTASNFAAGRSEGDLFEEAPGKTPDEIASSLLRVWGWPEDEQAVVRPLANCIRKIGGTAELACSVNDARIAFEGFLKDALRVAVSKLGWTELNMAQQVRQFCPDYRRKDHGDWKNEMATLQIGGALVLLRSLFPLAFPGIVDSNRIQHLCEGWSQLRERLNSRSHDQDPPLPPPTSEEKVSYCNDLEKALREMNQIVGEMPWHLNAEQTFFKDPVIVTGKAWSHSYPEGRVIRVLLWKGQDPSETMLVWNAGGLNPVMIEAELI